MLKVQKNHFHEKCYFFQLSHLKLLVIYSSFCPLPSFLGSPLLSRPLLVFFPAHPRKGALHSHDDRRTRIQVERQPLWSTIEIRSLSGLSALDFREHWTSVLFQVELPFPDSDHGSASASTTPMVGGTRFFDVGSSKPWRPAKYNAIEQANEILQLFASLFTWQR